MKEGSVVVRFVTLAVGARYRNQPYPHCGKLVGAFQRSGVEAVLVGDGSDKKVTRAEKPIILTKNQSSGALLEQ
jgi:hypothetical protein